MYKAIYITLQFGMMKLFKIFIQMVINPIKTGHDEIPGGGLWHIQSHFVSRENGQNRRSKMTVNQLINSQFTPTILAIFPRDKMALSQLFEFRRACAVG